MITVPYKIVNPLAWAPMKGSAGAAGFDLILPKPTELPSFSCPEGIELSLKDGVVMLDLGISFEIPKGYEGQIRLRSSLGKRGFIIPNAPGTIDSDYRGTVKILLANINSTPYNLIRWGERVCQLLIKPVPEIQFLELTDLSETDRGTGGFGSTGM